MSEHHSDEEPCYSITLYQSILLTEKDFNILVSEAAVSAILDSGASATVAGREWVESYVNGLPSELQKLCTYEDSVGSFRFGNDQKYDSLYKITLPARIGSHNIRISTDVVPTSVPL